MDEKAAARGIPSGARGLGQASVTAAMGPAAVGERSLAVAAAERHARAAADRERAFAAGCGGGVSSLTGAAAARGNGIGIGGKGSSGASAATRRVGITRGAGGVTVSVVPAYKAASRLSNKRLLRNALSHVCLAGAAMAREKEAALAALDAVPPDAASIFVILFRENTLPLKFRALYALMLHHGGDGSKGGRLAKIHGVGGPATIELEAVACTMKYDSGTREFQQLASRNLTPLTAAVTLVTKR